jgi:hypothetical protein
MFTVPLTFLCTFVKYFVLIQSDAQKLERIVCQFSEFTYIYFFKMYLCNIFPSFRFCDTLNFLLFQCGM